MPVLRDTDLWRCSGPTYPTLPPSSLLVLASISILLILSLLPLFHLVRSLEGIQRIVLQLHTRRRNIRSVYITRELLLLLSLFYVDDLECDAINLNSFLSTISDHLWRKSRTPVVSSEGISAKLHPVHECEIEPWNKKAGE